MGWAHCGTDSTGREIGYAIEATCDHLGCTAAIDRGLGYACGGEHGEDGWYCEKYFCGAHLLMTGVGQLCPTCYASFMDRVCQEWRCKAEAMGTLIEANGNRTRLCGRHGVELAGDDDADYFMPDHIVRIAKLDGKWDLVDGWSEVRAARGRSEPRVIATDRATGRAVWLIFTDNMEFQVELVKEGHEEAQQFLIRKELPV